VLFLCKGVDKPFYLLDIIYRKNTIIRFDQNETAKNCHTSGMLHFKYRRKRARGKEQERLVTMFKGLGNPIRFEIIKFLVTHPGCITGDIVKYLPIAQATVSQHLKVLKDAGWISGVIEGASTCYQLNEKNIAWFRSVVGEVF
jgi:ArsR family transcriptional regulator